MKWLLDCTFFPPVVSGLSMLGEDVMSSGGRVTGFIPGDDDDDDERGRLDQPKITFHWMEF